jgi:AcrR family transcriptional regulator
MPRVRVQQRYDSRRERLLDASWEFLLEQGYERATLNRLIAYAGTSKGAFYHYFDSREELMREVVERAIRAGIEEVEEGLRDAAAPAIEKLDRFLGVSASRPPATAALRRLLLQVHMSGDLALLERLQQRIRALCIAPLERIIAQGISEGVFETPCRNETADLIMVACNRALFDAIGSLLSELDAEHVAREWVRQVKALLHITERLLGIEQGTLDRVRPKDARALVELSRRENLQ